MKEETPQVPQLPKKLPRNILTILPRHLKDPKNYEKICKTIYEAGASLCDHAEVFEWYACNKCQQKQHERAEMMRKLGFKNGQQYLMWKKAQEYIDINYNTKQ